MNIIRFFSIAITIALGLTFFPTISTSASDSGTWILEETIYPAGGSEFVISEESDNPYRKGSYVEGSVNLATGEMMLHSHGESVDVETGEKNPSVDFISRISFEAPPQELTPGDSISLDVVQDDSTQDALYFFILYDPAIKGAGRIENQKWIDVKSFDKQYDPKPWAFNFTVPDTYEGELRLRFSNRNYRELFVEWVYRAGETAETKPATGGEHPLVGWVTASGKVYIERSGKRILVTKDGTPVLAGDRIITGSDALARVDLPSEDPALPGKYPGPNEQPSYSKLLTVSQFFEESPGLLILGENDEIEMHAPEDAPSQGLFGLIMGEVRAIVNNWPSGSIFNVKAGVTICGIRGSDVFISYDQDTERVEAYVIEGHMDVTNSETGEMKSLTDNQKLVVENGNIGEIQPLSQAEWDSLMKENGLEDMQPLSQEELDALLAEKNGDSSGSSAVIPVIIGVGAVVVAGLAVFGLRKRAKKA